MRHRVVAASRALIGAVLLMALAGASPVSAQAAGSKQVITGQTVTWAAGWEPEPDLSVERDNVELLVLRHGTTIVGYGGTAFPVGASRVRDMLLEGFASGRPLQTVDRGDYDNVSYSVDLTTRGDGSLAIFTLVTENPGTTSMSMLIASPDAFGSAMTDAQAGIAVDGVPIFTGVDPSQMQQTMATARPSAASPTAEATPPAATPGATPANTVTIAASGVEVRYSDDWAIRQQDDANLALRTVAQPAALLTVADLGPVETAPDPSALASGLQQRVESLNDAEVVAAVSPSPDRIVIVFRDPESSGTLYRIYDIAVDPATTTAVTLIVGEADLEAALPLVTSTVLVGGEPILADLRQLVPRIFGG